MKSYILVRTLYVCHLLLFIKLCVWHVQWRRLHRTHRVRAPNFTNGWAQGAPSLEEQQTRN